MSRAKKIIDKKIELRKATLERVPELAADLYFQKLLDELERTAELAYRSIPEHVSRRTGLAELAPISNREEDDWPLKAHARREVEIMKRETDLASDQELTAPSTSMQVSSAEPDPDPRRVFVVHGRNLKARDAMFTFLRSIG